MVTQTRCPPPNYHRLFDRLGNPRAALCFANTGRYRNFPEITFLRLQKVAKASANRLPFQLIGIATVFEKAPQTSPLTNGRTAENVCAFNFSGESCVKLYLVSLEDLWRIINTSLGKGANWRDTCINTSPNHLHSDSIHSTFAKQSSQDESCEF